MRCPKCGTAYPDDPDVNFCELDGTPLVSDAEYAHAHPDAPPLPTVTLPVPGCPIGQCADDGDGYCTVCGHNLANPMLPGTVAVPALAPAPFLGAATDQGKRHPTNQDNVALAIEAAGGIPVPLIVVCDGVSSARHSEETAAEAARVALASLEGYVASGAHVAVAPPQGIDPFADTVADLPVIAPEMLDPDATIADADALAPPAPPLEANPALTAMRDAIVDAHRAICALDDAPDPTLDPPGCTIVAAMVEPARITVGWVGDSRAYLLMGNDSRLLTRDHSYVNELIARGDLTEEEGAHSQYAHVITLCLGPLNSDADHPPEPSLVQIPHDRDGLLALCSDGLWNYAPDAVFMAKLAQEVGADADAQTIASHLTAFANAQGGLDNITVAIARLGDLPPPLSLDTPTSQQPLRHD